MSTRRVVVGLAAERTPLPSFVRRPGHVSAARPGAVMPRPVAQHAWLQRTLNLPIRSIHTTPTRHDSESRPRDPQTFHLTPPAPPSIHPHSSATTATSTTTTPSTPTPLPEQLRAVMRLVPHAAVVLTSTHGSGGVPRAMTISSFTSLTLHPTPLVSFNIAAPSRTLDAVSNSGQFNVHVLAADAAGARVADWFARGNAEEGRGLFDRLAVADGSGVDVVHIGEGKVAPVLEGEGVLYVLRCRVFKDGPRKNRGLVRVRDHVIVLGEVVEIVEGRGAERETEERFGLVYADRRYRQLGGCIAPVEEKGGEEEGGR